MSTLNKAQKEAVEYIEGPLLIIAGAGTGKTTVITQKIAYLIEQKLATPEQILALTFTDKAAKEMQERIDTMLDIGYVDLHISTFHSFCQTILEHYGLDIGLPNHFKLLSTTEIWLLVRENLQKFNLDYYRPLGNPTRHIHELIKHFNKCKDELISTADYLQYAEDESVVTGDMNIEESTRLKELANAYHAYNQLLLDVGALDFGDLIFYTLKLLKERPRILKKIQERFKYILVDEFQDVNWAQYKLIQLLTGEKNQLTVVGDDDQSIYAFRGASVSNILRFKDDYSKAKNIVLTENYRSNQSILDAAYDLIQHNNPDRLEAKLNINKKLQSKAVNAHKIGVEYIHTVSIEEEVLHVVKKIEFLKKSTPDVVWGDFAILVRANNHAEPFCNAFQKYGIPYEFLASSGLFRQSIVLDCYNFFKIISNFHESAAIYRLLCLPFFSLKENDLQKITINSKKKSVSYYEALKRSREFGLSTEGIVITEKILTLIHEGMKVYRNQKPSAVLYAFLEKSGYLNYLTHEEQKGSLNIIQSINYLNQFFEKITRYETESYNKATVSGFLEYVSYILESGDEGVLEQATDQDVVKVMTVHGSKGLEFKYVFIVNMVEDRFPSRRRGESIEMPQALIKEQLPIGDAHYQEERRLFYVALTRAKEHVFILNSEDYGGIRQKKISRFLPEIGFNPPLSATSKESKRNISSLLPNNTQDASIDQKIVYEIPKAFSFSQLKSYATCPYQYKLANIIKIPTKGNASFSFGQTIHSTLQKFYEGIQRLNRIEQISLFSVPEEKTALPQTIQTPSFEELLKLYDESWIEDWYKDAFQREGYYEKGKKILKEFYTTHEQSWTVPVSLEGWFKIKLGDFLMHGRIDRIDQLPDGTLEIIDYKTGASKEKVSGDEKDQLLIYQMAAEKLPQYAHIGKPSKLTFFYINDNIKVSFLGTTKEIEQLQTKLIELITQIHEGNFTPTPNPFICNSCDFKDICDYRIL